MTRDLWGEQPGQRETEVQVEKREGHALKEEKLATREGGAPRTGTSFGSKTHRALPDEESMGKGGGILKGIRTRVK